MRGICKSFPGVRALRGVDLELEAGQVLALVGENGAGKSTLIRVLAGAHLPDAGSIRIDGQPAAVASPWMAQRLGIAVMHQEFNLVPFLSARENMFLGCERTRAGFLRSQDERASARRLLARVGVDLDPDTPCRQLSVAQQQIVEVCRALARQARIVVMDEPSAALTVSEVQRLFGIIGELKAQGIGLVYISHRLDEVLALADRIVVLRDGERVAACERAEATRERLIEWMVGRKLEQEFPARQATLGPDRLVARGLSRRPDVHDVSFRIRAGEVLGMTGLVGAGRTETARLLFGADRPEAGTVELDGRPVRSASPADAIRAGIALLTEDRKAQGLVLAHAVRENFGLPNLRRFARGGWIRGAWEREALGRHVRQLGIRIASPEQRVRELSGGNQQKVVLAKWLERDCEAILFDEPTRGIDVGAKYEVYQLINRLAAQGKAILMISSELPEVLGMSDRILVMRQGRIAGEIADARQADARQIMELAVG